MPYADRTTLNNLTPNLDIGDVADPALRLAFFQYITNLMDANYAEQQALITSGTLSPVPPDSLYRQALVNPGLGVIQRYAALGSATLTTSTSAYLVDHVKSFNGGSGANATVSQAAVSDLDGTGYGLRIVHDATPTTGGKLGHTVTVEARDAYKLAGQQVVYALKVKAVSGMDKLTITARYKTSESAISSSDTLVLSTGAISISSTAWQTIPLVVTLPIRATLTTSGVIGFEMVGSKSTSEASGDGFIIAELELIKSGTDLGFNPRSFAEELILCLRYFEKSFSYATKPANGAGAAGIANFRTSATDVYQTIPRVRYVVDKRTNPTITLYNPANASPGTSYIRNYTSSVDLPALIGEPNEKGFRAYVNNTSVAGQQDLAVHWVADAEL